MADRLSDDGGQKAPINVVHKGMVASWKNRNVDPVSRNPGEVVPLYDVAMVPVAGSLVNTETADGVLFGCVPIPKIRAPVRVAAPLLPTAGNRVTDPLLSVGSTATGFWTKFGG